MPIWQEALRIAENVHALTDGLPRKEDYGFTSQIRRAALSISANIAEAFGCHHSGDKINFYYIARGSLTELESHMEYGKRVGYFEAADQEKLEVALLALHHDLNKVIATLKASKNNSQP
jgi:four helix bundle protein